MLDPRTTLARPDLADVALEGLVQAARYATPEALACAAASSGIRKAPAQDAEQQDQLLFGERFDVLDRREGWAWGQARRDGYVGWVRLQDLSPAEVTPTHAVRVLRTVAFARPDMKTQPCGFFSLNSLVAARETDGKFVRVEGAGWMVAEHLSPLGESSSDWAQAAELYLNAPYLWGGRESLGLDCSGLVQQALYACGRSCPRDSDQQSKLGREVQLGDLARGDLVFWPGHVAMMVDRANMIHANAFHMAVRVEPLMEAMTRIERAGVGRPISFRRL